MLRRAIVPVVVWLAAFVTLAPAPVESQNEAVTSAVPRTSWGAPDLAGIWDFRTSTPLQRPEEFGDRASLTDEEAAEFEEGAVDRLFARARAVGGSESNVELWPDRGTEMAGDNRTSLIVDPPDGRVPPRTSSGQRRRETVGAFPVERNSDGPEDRSLAARCIMWTPTPLTPTFSNNNVQVFQTRDYVAIYHEMIHDARIIPLDGHPHLDERIRQLRGDSRGHWEGDTLVRRNDELHRSDNFRRFRPEPASRRALHTHQRGYAALRVTPSTTRSLSRSLGRSCCRCARPKGPFMNMHATKGIGA